MSMFSATKDSKAPAEEVPIHRIRITLTSRNVKSLEKGSFIVQSAFVYWFNLIFVSSKCGCLALKLAS